MNSYTLYNFHGALTVRFFYNSDRKIGVRGFTFIEIMIVMAIIGTLSAIAAPNYLKYKNKGKIALAMTDIRIIEKEIMCYWIDTGELPDSLSDLTNGNLTDPWGNPYQYLKIDGITAGIVDNPSDTRPTADDNPSDSRPTADDNPSDSVNPGVLGKMRRDHFLVPVNTDFDLYSLGKDGLSQSPFTAAASQDDIVRANNGLYVGLVSEY
jgi:general secretion pathway protein G